MIDKIYVYGNDEHALNVFGAFAQALSDNGVGWSGTVVYGYADIATALAEGCQLYIKSTTGMEPLIAEALLSSPGIQVFMPAGLNVPGTHVYDSGGVLPCIIVTGAGDEANETAYDIEFFANDPITPEAIPDEQDLSSFGNGYIAGQITAITIITACTTEEAREAARATGTRNGVWIAADGYGKINVGAAATLIIATMLAENIQLNVANAALLAANEELQQFAYTQNVNGITLTKETKYGTSEALTLGKISIEETGRVAVVLNHCISTNDLSKEPLETSQEFFDSTAVKDFIYAKYCEAKLIDLDKLITN